MPSVPGRSRSRESERLAKLPAGFVVVVTVRKKLTRNSFTIGWTKVLMLLRVPRCTLVGVMAGKPGTLAAANGSYTLDQSL